MKNKNIAFTVIELIVVITILAILGTIAFISFEGYVKKARDTKRISDVKNLLSKIEYEHIKGISYVHFLRQGYTENKLKINGIDDIVGYKGYVDFDKLKEDRKSFLDPLTGGDYLVGVLEKNNSIGVNHNYIQIGTIKEEYNKASVVGNYSPILEYDSPSLLIVGGKYIIDDEENLPYSIDGKCLATTIDGYDIPSTGLNESVEVEVQRVSEGVENGIEIINSTYICRNYEFELQKSNVTNTCTNGYEYIDGQCFLEGEWQVSNGGYRFVSTEGEAKYPYSCWNIINDLTYKTTKGTSPFDGTKYIDGIYYIKVGNENEQKIYCDMTIDGGGWMQTFYGTNTNSAQNLSIEQVLINGKALKTYSSNVSSFPVLTNGTINNFGEVLFKGGNATWQGKKGNWSIISTYPVGTTTIPIEYKNVKNANGTKGLWYPQIGWGATTASITSSFGLWDFAGRSPICGGANAVNGKNCPSFAYTTAANHYDVSSVRHLLVRDKCMGNLPSRGVYNGTALSGGNRNFSTTPGGCTYTCLNGYKNGNCSGDYGWNGNSTDGYEFFDENGVAVYPASCHDLIDNEKFQVTSGITKVYNGTKFLDGVYYIKPDTGEVHRVYCDMTIDGGGWTLTFYGKGTSQIITMSQMVIKGNAMKTYTSDSTNYPILANGTINNYNELLFKGGNATWQGKKGARSIVGMFPASSATTVSTAYLNAKNANGTEGLWHYRKGWREATIAVTQPLGFWDFAGRSPICGGADAPGGKNCPRFHTGASAYHFDATSIFSLFVR